MLQCLTKGETVPLGCNEDYTEDSMAPPGGDSLHSQASTCPVCGKAFTANKPLTLARHVEQVDMGIRVLEFRYCGI